MSVSKRSRRRRDSEFETEPKYSQRRAGFPERSHGRMAKTSRRAEHRKRSDVMVRMFMAQFSQKLRQLKEEFQSDMRSHVRHLNKFICGLKRDQEDVNIYVRQFLKCRELEARRTHSLLALLKHTLINRLKYSVQNLRLDLLSVCSDLETQIDDAWMDFERFKREYFKGFAPHKMFPPYPDAEHKQALHMMQTQLYYLFCENGATAHELLSSSDSETTSSSDTEVSIAHGSEMKSTAPPCLSEAETLSGSEKDSPHVDNDTLHRSNSATQPTLTLPACALKNRPPGTESTPREAVSKARLPRVLSNSETNVKLSNPQTYLPRPESTVFSDPGPKEGSRGSPLRRAEQPTSVSHTDSFVTKPEQRTLKPWASMSELDSACQRLASKTETYNSKSQTTNASREFEAVQQSRSMSACKTQDDTTNTSRRTAGHFVPQQCRQPFRSSATLSFRTVIPNAETAHLESSERKPDSKKSPSNSGETGVCPSSSRDDYRIPKDRRKDILIMFLSRRHFDKRRKAKSTSDNSSDSKCDNRVKPSAAERVIPTCRSPSPVLEAAARPQHAPRGDAEPQTGIDPRTLQRAPEWKEGTEPEQTSKTEAGARSDHAADEKQQKRKGHSDSDAVPTPCKRTKEM